MANLYATIAALQVAGSDQRWLRDASGTAFVWNASTGQYQTVMLPSALGDPGAVQLALDPSGTAYALGQGNGQWAIASWSPDNLSFANPVPVTPPGSGVFTSFAVADGTFWFVQDEQIYSAPVGSSITPTQAPIDLANPDCYPIQVTAAQQDGTVWILDQQNNLYSWDGSRFALMPSNGTLPPSVQLIQVAVVDGQRLYGLDQYGGVWQWSSVASQFVNVSSSINNGNLEFQQLQA
ncbi:MAG: hypothetical protein ACK55D_08325, partial [Synechococcaceae cyanobacterium]